MTILRNHENQFWQLIRHGMSPVEAAASVALSAKRARGLFKRRGRVIPGFVYRRSSGRYLCLEERMLILVGVERGESLRAFARTLGRAPSTVPREVRRSVRDFSHYHRRPTLRRGRWVPSPRRPPSAPAWVR